MIWVVYALVAAVFHAASSLISKKVMLHEHAIEFGASRGFVSLILVFALPFIEMGYPWQTYLAIYAVSVLVSLGMLYYLRSIRHSALSSSIPLMNISPLFLLIIAFVLLGERPDALAIAGVFLLVAGTYLLQTATSGHGVLAPFKALVTHKYSLYMVFAVLIFSFTATMEKALVNSGVNVYSLLVLLFLFIGVNFVAVGVLQHGWGELFTDLRKDGLNITLGMASTIISACAYYLAMAVPGALIALIIPVKRVSTFITALVAGKLFHEHRLGLKLTACAIMIVGVALIAF